LALLDLTNSIIVAPVEVSVAILASSVSGRLDVSFAGAGTWSVEGELLEVERAAKMPGDLFERSVRSES
jgi:hypothetical protein